MKFWHWGAVLTALGTAAFGFGCSSDPAGPGTPSGTNTFESSVDLNKDAGGIGTGDETPAFGMRGNPDLAEETPYTDDLVANRPDVSRLEDDPDASVTFLRVVWGDLSRDSTHASDMTWDGGLTVDGGAIVVKRLIRFEHEDHIVRPRTARDTLKWVSKTHGGVDGVIVKIIVPAPTALTTVAGPNITFFSPNFTTTLDLAALADRDTSFAVDNTGNAVAFGAVRPPRHGPRCPHGFADGGWNRVPDDSVRGGVFRGKWVDSDGTLEGHLDGRWGMNDKGKRVWAGKFIDDSGRFQGIVHGEWKMDPLGHLGDFGGRWLDADHRIAGNIHGHFFFGDSATDGHFEAVWIMHCHPGPPDPPPGGGNGDGGSDQR